MAVITMSIAEWSQVPDNPKQRDTVRRAKYASRFHLKAASPIHRFVYAASKDGAVLCKLDGHTRSYLWDNGRLTPPHDGTVDVLLIPAKSMAHAAELYDHLDNSKARKKPNDEIFGALRQKKIFLKSSLLHSCEFSNQLKLADRGSCKGSGVDIGTVAQHWGPHLVALDGLGLSKRYTVLIGLMLATIRCDGIEKAGPFWVALDADEGTKKGGKMDGVEALSQHMKVRKAEGRTSGYENIDDMFSRGYTAYRAWQRGVLIRSLRTSDVSELYAKKKAVK